MTNPSKEDMAVVEKICDLEHELTICEYKNGQALVETIKVKDMMPRELMDSVGTLIAEHVEERCAELVGACEEYLKANRAWQSMPPQQASRVLEHNEDNPLCTYLVKGRYYEIIEKALAKHKQRMEGE
jgi:hypothetical protein